ncbi:MAG: hypothetical protein ACRD4Y_03360 [Candidatus Acidiferrales bacterium]
MKRAIIPIIFFVLGVPASAFAQDGPATTMIYRSQSIALGPGKAAPVSGAPYSADITVDIDQTLGDGTHITQTMTGSTARDSQGRTRQDAPLPKIGNLAAENPPHIIFIMDPVAQVAYTLNLTDKTAQKMPMGSGAVQMPDVAISTRGGVMAGVAPPPPGGPGPGEGNQVFIQSGGVAVANGGAPMPSPIFIQKSVIAGDSSDVKTEDLGSQSMEGLEVTGTRTTRTIPTGQIGNDRPISIVTEVWTSPDLKTIVYSKRSDPRMGEQTFKLTNITLGDPDPSLFTVPADFKVVEGPQRVLYGINK